MKMDSASALLLSPAFGFAYLLTAVLWVLAKWENPKARNLLWLVFAIGIGATFVFVSALDVANRICPWKYDQLLSAIDGAMGLSAVSARDHSPNWLRLSSLAVYVGGGWVMLALAMAHISHPWGELGNYMRASLLSSALAAPLYLIVPACGPRLAVKAFDGTLQPLLLSGWPNSVPSMHIAGALTLLMFAGPCRRWRIGLSAYVAATAVSTVVTGEHYFIDWFPSIPFVICVVSAVRGRYRNALLSFGALLAWLLVLRFGGAWLVDHPAASWALVASTVLAGGWGLLRYLRPDPIEDHRSDALAPSLRHPVHPCRSR